MSESTDIDPLGATAAGEEARTAGLSDSARRAIEQDAQLRSGAQLQHFRVEELLGKGAMGAVYSAHDDSLDRAVALKVLPAELAANQTFIQRFVREAQAQAKLSHPNVVPIYFIGEQANRWFFAMEKVDGESLDDMLDRGETLSWEQALDVAEAVASALGMAQEKGLIHRDIKPSNILLATDGTYKVADFGLAKPTTELSDDEKKLTQDGAFVGTPLYVAPEQARGETVDHRADMYSLGATLYHLVTGEPVFDGDSLVSIVAKHASEPPPIDKLPGSNDFRRLVERLLHKKAEDRFRSWADAARAITEARPAQDRPGSMVARYFANTVDLFLAALIVEPLTTDDQQWVIAVFLALYVTIGVRWRGRTVGKWLFRLRVVDVEGGRPSWWQATARTLLTWIPAWYMAGATLWLTQERFKKLGHMQDGEVFSAPPGFYIPVFILVLLPVIMAVVAFVYSRDRHKRTYADRLAGTRVLQS